MNITKILGIVIGVVAIAGITFGIVHQYHRDYIGKTIGLDGGRYYTMCIDGVQYLKDSDGDGEYMSVKFNQNGTVSTCPLHK